MTTVTKQIYFARKDRWKIALPGVEPDKPGTEGRIPRIAKLMALAIRYDGLLRDGVVSDLTELARLGHVTQPRITQIMNLLHLAPDIQDDILHLPPVRVGEDPVTEHDLRPMIQLRRWEEQRAVWAKVKAQQTAPPTTRSKAWRRLSGIGRTAAHAT